MKKITNHLSFYKALLDNVGAELDNYSSIAAEITDDNIRLKEWFNQHYKLFEELENTLESIVDSFEDLKKLQED